MQRTAQPFDRKRMREINQNTLLNLIRSYAPVPRSRLKELSGLSMGTIVGITSILIDQKLVVESGTAKSTGGRKPGLLEIFPDGGYAIGLSLKEYEIAGILLRLDGSVVYTENWEAPLRDNAEYAVETISAGVERFIQHSGIEREKIIGLGCGVSGPVNAETGTSIYSSILHWHTVELGRPLGERLQMSVFVDNAVNCLASYEHLYGYGQRYHDFLLVTLGRGVGLATLLRGDLFRGSQGIGAEFGHIPFLMHGRRCECGNVGCLEAYVSDRGLLQTYHELSSQVLEVNDAEPELAVQELYRRANNGDEVALETFHCTGAYLGSGLAAIINLFNPQALIIYGGEKVNRVNLLFDTMKKTMDRHLFPYVGKDLALIVEPRTTMENWARGAGCLVLRHFFATPSQTYSG